MQTAINGTVWSGLGKALGVTYDWKRIVSEAAQAGYEGIEMGGSEESLGKARDTRAFIEGRGLRIAAWFASVTYNPWAPNTAAYQKAIRYAAELEVPLVTVCGGFMSNQRRNTMASDYDMFAGNLGRAMRFAARHGVTLAFHPHRGCIVETITETRALLKRLPDLRLCIDTAHLEACGENTVAFIKAFGPAIIATHIKDYSWKQDSFVEPGKGDGTLDVAKAITALRAKGYSGWYTIELDRNWERCKQRPQPLAVARRCRKFLAALNA